MGIDILGINLNMVPLREAVRKTDEFFESGGMNTIAYISADKLVLADEKEELRELWFGIDLKLCGDVEILKAAGAATPARIKEVEENSYLHEFLRKLVKGQKAIFLLSDSEEHLQKLENELKNIQSNLYIAGRDALEHYPDSKDGLVNAMNLVAPRVILSGIAYPEGMRFMHEYRNYLNASVWLALPDKISENQKETVLDKINKFIYKTAFRKKMNRSKDMENE